eukprot:8440720-Lingulodinium_polyedra.AAC.1
MPDLRLRECPGGASTLKRNADTHRRNIAAVHADRSFRETQHKPLRAANEGNQMLPASDENVGQTGHNRAELADAPMGNAVRCEFANA